MRQEISLVGCMSGVRFIDFNNLVFIGKHAEDIRHSYNCSESN